MGDTNIPSKVLSPSKLAHVVLRTANFKASLAFYQAFLGARVVYANDKLAFLTYDEEHHRIALAGIPDTQPKVRNSSGLEHIAFTFDSLTDLTTAYTQRKALGILPVWCTNHGPTTSMYYQDPDGNMLETQADNFDTVEEAIAYMEGPELAENPIGVDFDPEHLIRRLESGESESEIKKRPNIGPRAVDDKLPFMNLPEPDVREHYGPIGASV